MTTKPSLDDFLQIRSVIGQEMIARTVSLLISMIVSSFTRINIANIVLYIFYACLTLPQTYTSGPLQYNYKTSIHFKMY